jgi:hypothetical protein
MSPLPASLNYAGCALSSETIPCADLPSGQKLELVHVSLLEKDNIVSKILGGALHKWFFSSSACLVTTLVRVLSWLGSFFLPVNSFRTVQRWDIIIVRLLRELRKILYFIFYIANKAWLIVHISREMFSSLDFACRCF